MKPLSFTRICRWSAFGIGMETYATARHIIIKIIWMQKRNWRCCRARARYFSGWI